MSQQWYRKKWVAVSLHLLFWSLFFLSPLLFQSMGGGHRPDKDELQGLLQLHITNNIFRAAFFYANAYFLIPHFVYRRKFSTYLLSLLGCFFFMFLWDRFFFNLFIEGWHHSAWNFVLFNLPFYIFLIIASAAFRLIRDRVEEDQYNQERETENLKTELSFLRSQVSPHFMFNVLNNMVALARKKSDDLEPSLIKLSSLLRYMLYETGEDKVPVEKEIEYLQSYIDLQRQRFGKNVAIHACLEKIHPGYHIEPMLLIPFVENAFKHGTGFIQDAQINIQLKEENGVLHFTVKNRTQEGVQETRDKTSGIGLTNVKRRLNLLYSQSHALQIEKEEGWFTVALQLNLH